MIPFFGYNLPIAPTCGKPTTEMLNNYQLMEIFNRIANVALARFKWIGLPETCQPDILEQTLFFYGKALFFYDEQLGYLHTPVNLPGPFNVYYESIRRQARSFQYNKMYTIDDSVLIKANYAMFPDVLTVMNYAPKIANGLRAIDVHTETLKRPFMITCPDKMVQSVRQILDKIADNEVAIVGEKLGDNGDIKVLPFGATSNLPDMWANIKNYFNQVYSSLGVRNSFTEKRERMITSEVEGEGNAVRHDLESELYERELACERINDMYGLDVHVEANELEDFMDEMIEVQAARVSGNIESQQEQTKEVEA